MPVYIVSVGSNIDAEKHIQQAFSLIQKIDPKAKSASLLHTKPVGFIAQADFINTSFSFHCALGSVQLKAHLRNIEAQLGRVRTNNKNGPRTIDLDIVKIGSEIVDDDYYRYEFVKKLVDELVPKVEK